MVYDLSKFDELVEQKLLRRFENGNLVAYDYTDKCTYDKAWNEYTSIARGIVFEKTTGKLIAKPFPKFFNLGEMPETYLTNLPNRPYDVTEKVDGSLGIIYFYDGEWRVNTRGSFSSEQAIKAKEMLKKYNSARFNKNHTYLAEIIYPNNKIVVDYGKEEKLVLLSVIDTESGIEASDVSKHAVAFDMPWTKSYDYTVEEMIELQKTMPKDQEGFVIRFENGFRVKIKGHEYLKIHKIISCLSPLSAWEVMENGKVKREYLEQIPEEYRIEFQPIVDALEKSYVDVMAEILNDYILLPTHNFTQPDAMKTIGLFLKEPNDLKHPGAVFSHIKNDEVARNKYIMKQIRPTGNIL